MRIRLNHQRLVELIAESRLSQNHWAIKLGLSKGHWSGIVHGKHPYPSKKTQDLLMEIFGVPFEELFFHESRSGADVDFQAAISDRYLLEKEIGQGGMGTVYLARDVRLGRTVAVKVVSTEAVSGIGAEQFLKEIRLTTRLQHQNILPLYDAGVAAGAPYYVMPYMTSGSLRSLLEREPVLAIERVIAITSGVGAALTHAHDRHILHCDVKPENILIAGDHSFVADFGIARAIHAESFEWARRTEIDSSAGTPAYVSPEQATGERNLDARSDVYSFGCVVFEMLAGRPPFTGTTTMETVAKRFVATPSLRRHAPHVPSSIASALARAMDVDPAERPESVESFAEGLKQAAARRRLAVVENVSLVGTRMISRTSRSLNARFPLLSKLADEVVRDVQYAFRTLKRSPVFALITILTLALGIGANTAVFTVVNGVLLRPLPYHDADELMMVWSADQVAEPDGVMPDTFTVTEADYLDWRGQSTSFADMAAFNISLPSVSDERGAEPVLAGVTTTNFFSLIGAHPMLGAGFTPEHDVPGNGQVVVLSHGFWRRWFGADSDVLSRTLSISGRSFDVVGVMAPTYQHLDPSLEYGNAEFWTPISFDAAGAARGGHYLRVIGRLSRGKSVSEARAEFAAIARQLEFAYPETNAGETAVVIPLRDQHYGSVGRALLLILGAAGFVLLIVCANVGNLVLARSQIRRRELAVRTSLGAGRVRLARQLVVENGLLSFAGGVVGLLLVVSATDLIRSLQGPFLSRVADIHVDLSVVVFMAVVSLVVGIAFGLLPLAELFKTDIRDVLNEDSAAGGVGRRTLVFRNTLVVVQVCVAVVLLIGAGLLTRSFLSLMNVAPGFETQSALTMEISTPRFKYPEESDRVRFFDELVPELSSLPGVQEICLVSDLPFTSENRFNRFAIGGTDWESEETPLVEYRTLGPGYFRVMGIELLAGREFETTDREATPLVAVINQEMANRYSPGASPIGRELVQVIRGSDDVSRATIVGVVADILDDGFDSQPEPRVYYPYAQRPTSRMFAVLRSAVEPGSLALLARERLRQLDPQVPVGSVKAMEGLVAETLSTERLSMALATSFSAIGMLLAAIGVYGLMAFVVGARRREIGIRTAMGADARNVIMLVVRKSLGLTAIGVAAGIAVGAVLARLLSALLFGVTPFDPLSYTVPAVALLLLALVASYLPARRAAQVEPVEALRVQ
jgi:putative ABC transport system permease protein